MNAACKGLVERGGSLVKAGKLNEALDCFEEAKKADPTAASPWGFMAHVYLMASTMTAPEHVGDYQSRARSQAKKALSLDDAEPRALGVLGQLALGARKAPHPPGREASAVFSQGAAHFARGAHREALACYERAASLEPGFAAAVKYAGDCYFAVGQAQQAEAWFRRAISLDPLDAQAHKFVADALLKQGKAQEAEAALIASIAANPAYASAWATLSSLRARAGRPMRPFRLTMAATPVIEPDGRSRIDVDQQAGSPADVAAAMVLATGRVAHARKAQSPAAELRSYAAARAGFSDMLMHVEQLCRQHNNQPPGLSPAFVELLRVARDNHLDTALFLLFFEEAFRPAFEDFKQKYPWAISHFINGYGLRPF